MQCTRQSNWTVHVFGKCVRHLSFRILYLSYTVKNSVHSTHTLGGQYIRVRVVAIRSGGSISVYAAQYAVVYQSTKCSAVYPGSSSISVYAAQYACGSPGYIA